MRKLLTLTLAVAMVLSLAAVAFAADYNVSANYASESDSRVNVPAANVLIGYGKTAYYVLTYHATDAPAAVQATAEADFLVDYDAAKEVKVKPQWTQNADLVEKVSVIKKRLQTSSTTSANNFTNGQYAYCIAIQLKNKDTTASAEVAGKMEISVKSGNTIDSGTAKLTINPFISVGYGKATGAGAEATLYTLTDSDKIAEFGTGKDFAETEDFELTLHGEAGIFTVNTQGQGKILLSSSVKYNEGLENIYPDANYVYINGNGKSFNKTGELKLWANEGDFLYQVKNGKLVKLNAEYDDVEEAFIIKTRTLGTYVVAEEELDLSAQEAPAAPVEEAPAPVNPETGAAA